MVSSCLQYILKIWQKNINYVSNRKQHTRTTENQSENITQQTCILFNVTMVSDENWNAKGMNSVIDSLIAWYKDIVRKTFSAVNTSLIKTYGRNVKNTINFAETKKGPSIKPLTLLLDLIFLTSNL